MALLLTVLAAVLYAVGWVVGIVAVGVKWAWSALGVGWDDAHRVAQRPPTPEERPLRPVPPWPAERSG